MSNRYPHDHENDVIYFGKTNFRNQLQKFGIKTDDRRRHLYVIGKTGMGKTTLLENMILADIYAGHGCCYVDPHGDTAEKLINYIPSWRINDVVYFNPSDLEYPFGFNILESIDPDMKHLVASALMSVFKKIWENVWSARMEYILNNTILALLDTPGSTLLGVNRMLSDKVFRLDIVKNIKDPIVKQFWIQEFAAYEPKFASEAVAPIQNKIGQFLSSSIIRNIVAQAKSSINIREIIDSQKILIINLSKGRIGEDAMRLLGGMLITKVQIAAMERINIPELEREDFYLYVDEFQNFAVESFAGILSEARKYRLNLIMAHQYITQLSEEVRDAVFGNVGTMVTFRVGSPDAVFLENEFMPRFTPEDIINLPKAGIYLKLMIDGVASQPFSAITLPPIGQSTGSTEKVIEQSRERYAGNRGQIEERVSVWSGFGEQVDVEAKLAEVSQAKKDAKREAFMEEYSCTRCKKTFKIPVKLDRARPVYCEECKPIIDTERQKGKDHHAGNSTGKPVSFPNPGPSSVAPPSPMSGTIVAIPTTGELSLVSLTPIKKPEVAPISHSKFIPSSQVQTSSPPPSPVGSSLPSPVQSYPIAPLIPTYTSLNHSSVNLALGGDNASTKKKRRKKNRPAFNHDHAPTPNHHFGPLDLHQIPHPKPPVEITTAVTPVAPVAIVPPTAPVAAVAPGTPATIGTPKPFNAGQKITFDD